MSEKKGSEKVSEKSRSEKSCSEKIGFIDKLVREKSGGEKFVREKL